ncbi:MAG: tetratricopeptide repeat protein [Magnetococcales bacterium]|nr:tetratricopeptide repeat protein [Magnetococcales bacterium]MBF0155601.1 tetratricopeptide repeat protein [Magnetococcales bacterium]
MNRKLNELAGRVKVVAISLPLALWGCLGPSQVAIPSDESRSGPPVAGFERSEAVTKVEKAVFSYIAGHLLLEDNQWNEAEDAFKEVASADVEALDARVLVAHLATQRGDLSVAGEYARQVLERDADESKTRLLLAGVLTASKAYSEAATQYEELLKREPDNARARILLAQIYGLLKTATKAAKVLEPLLGDPEWAWQGHLALGRSWANQGELEKALKPFRQAYRLESGNLEPVLALGAALQELKRPKEAEKVYRDFLERHPDSKAVHGRLGRLLLTRDDREAALEEFREISRLAPDSVQARLTTALILLSRKDYDEALQELRLAEALGPDNSGVYYYLGQALESLDRDSEAVVEYDKVQNGQPFYLESQLRLAFLDASRGADAAAVERLRQLTASNPERVDLVLALSMLLLQAKDYPGVVETSTKGLALDPAQSRLRFNRAMALDKLQRWPEAEADLKTYISDNPTDAHALNYLGYTWAERGENLEESHQLLRKAVKLAPGDGFITDSLGWVLFRMKRLEESLTMMREAVRLEPGDPTIAEHLGDVLEATGRVDEAVKVWRKALELDAGNQRLRDKIGGHGHPL